MTNNVSIIDEIINGKDFLVVLESRYGRHYKESYSLDTIIVKGNMFWGKFANVHSPVGHELINISTPLSYAYNNFSDVVCIMNHAAGIQIFTSSKSYSRMQFKVRGRFELALSGDNVNENINFKILNNAVENALKINLVVCDENNIVHVIAVHTVELYDDKKYIGVDTNYESVPTQLYDFDLFFKLESRFNEVVGGLSEGESVGTNYMFNSHFSIISYAMKDGGIYKRVVNSEGSIKNVLVEYRWFKVYCEV
ncbi:MAG: hypothetical protein RPR97_03605 [Colwellia sp.]|jgi:hypothetical protein